MKHLIFVFLCIGLSLKAQNKVDFLVLPYLQNAEPKSITIMWETSTGEESVVEWGTTPKLGKESSGKAFEVNYGTSRLHEVRITGLKRFTEYYYRVKTEGLTSDIYQFKTPPFADQEESFNLIAMSDMQQDRQHPDKFSEVVNDGVIKYLQNEFGGELPDNLALVMIPGDLVVTGSVYEQWQKHFFHPAEKLFAEVPVYPVLGNHEQNSQYYFKYFSLPKNGHPAYHEHWWYKDYGNVRIIGLNSNDGYADSKYQFEWLKEVLDDTANNEAIDFVFAQLHHPHKSELWLPGERDSSGKVVKMLETFSNDTGKPTIHFFGHTHGYSRGQSKEHNHLWVNVASAGGAIDNWGEFESRDYEEFTVTEDTYGFVMISVDANKKDPKITLKRLSLGNYRDGIEDNKLTDSITVYKITQKPETPKAISPVDVVVDFTNVVLKASTFIGKRKNAFHAASQWQIAKSKDFGKPLFDSWKQYENWYYLENRQKNDDLTDEQSNRLEPETTYYWRVRYRDQFLNWSDWSETATFTTQQK